MATRGRTCGWAWAIGCCAIGTMLLAPTAGAETITIQIDPTEVPDEEAPRVNAGDAPAGFAPDSWQGPAAGPGNKSNWHARYLADGDALSALFPDDAATLTIADIAEISYFTNRPLGTPAGRDWWLQIYTRPTGVGDNASWHHDRFINDFGSHAAIGSWTEHSTSGGMIFQSNGLGGPVMTFAQLVANHGGELVEMISVQTDSAWNGFDGFLDGLVITLTDGDVGRVNFEAAGTAAALTIAPDPLAFPPQTVGSTSAPGAVTLTNTGATGLTVFSVDPAAAPFAEAAASSTCLPLPATLGPGEACTLAYTYSPTLPGEDVQAIAVVTDLPGPVAGFILQGTAVAPAITEVPTLSGAGLAALLLALGVGGVLLLRRRATA